MNTQDDQQVLNEALRVATFGRPVFPCRLCPDACLKCDICKAPACPRGFHRASIDAQEIRELWRKHPGQLVGVPTGQASGIFVVDIDSGRHDEATDWFERWSPYLPETRQHATGSGGWHLLLKHREGLGGSASKLARGVDTRGDGGYIIWWPFHLGLNAPHKLDLPLGELPDEIYQQLIGRPQPRAVSPSCRPRVRQHGSRIDGLLLHLQRSREGERNSMLFWCANRICDMAKAGEMGRSEVSGALQSLAGAAHQVGLSIREIEKTINSATTGGRR